jgi:cytochrome c553
MTPRFAIFLFCGIAAAAGPQYTDDNQLIRPENYREWVYLSSGHGMSYGPNASQTATAPPFDNVFVTPEAYRAFLTTGSWPDKTIFALEIRRAASEGSINKGGSFQTDLLAVEFEVKDEARFPQKWAFFGFSNQTGSLAKTAKAQPATSTCNTCHGANGAVDNTFVQFYPTLIDIARQKGTFKPSK